MQQLTFDYRFTRYAHLFLWLMLAIGLVVERSIGICANMLLLAGTFIYFHRHRRLKTGAFTRSHLMMCLALMGSGVAILVSISLTSPEYQKLSRLDLALRYFLAPCLFLALCHTRLSAYCLSASALVGLCFAAYIGFHGFEKIGVAIASGAVGHHIVFGNLSALMALVCLVASFYQQYAFGRWLGLMGFVLGVTSMIFSGSRGALFAFAFTYCFVIVWRYLDYWRFNNIDQHQASTRKTTSRYLHVITAMTLGLLAMVSWYFYDSILLPRYNAGIKDLHLYLTEGAVKTSLGARLEMWVAGIKIFFEHPIFGSGPKSFLFESHALIDQGAVRDFGKVFHYKHAHNQIIDTLANTGIIGFIAWLALIMAPLWQFCRAFWNSADQHERQFAEIGMVICVGYFSAGVTETLFDRHLATVFYLVIVCACLSQLQKFRMAYVFEPSVNYDQKKWRRVFRKFSREVVAAMSKVCLKSVNLGYRGQRFNVPMVHGVGAFHFLPDFTLWCETAIRVALRLQPQGAFIDVGANVGQFLLNLRSVSSTAPYYGFEPNPTCVYYLYELIMQNEFKNTQVFPVALGIKSEIKRLHSRSRISGTSTLLAQSAQLTDTQPNSAFSTTVVCADAEHFLEQLDPELKVGFIKIDVEGYELEVLTGLRSLLEAQSPVLFVEVLTQQVPAQRLSSLWDLCLELNYCIFTPGSNDSDRAVCAEQVCSLSALSECREHDFILIKSALSDQFLQAFSAEVKACKTS